MLVARESHRAFAQQRRGIGRPAGGENGVLHVSPQQRAARRAHDFAAAPEGQRIIGGERGHGRGRSRRIDRQRAAFHVGDRAAVGCGLRRQHLLELLEPGALLRRVRVRIDQPGRRPQRPYPGVHAELPEQPDEANQVAPRAGAPGQIEFARLRLMVVGRNGKLHRLHADILQPHQLALPEACAGRDSRGTPPPAGNRRTRPRVRPARLAAGRRAGSKLLASPTR